MVYFVISDTDVKLRSDSDLIEKANQGRPWDLCPHPERFLGNFAELYEAPKDEFWSEVEAKPRVFHTQKRVCLGFKVI
jgi:hypothetical protein